MVAPRMVSLDRIPPNSVIQRLDRASRWTDPVDTLFDNERGAWTNDAKRMTTLFRAVGSTTAVYGHSETETDSDDESMRPLLDGVDVLEDEQKQPLPQ